jgi:hypothetical protein
MPKHPPAPFLLPYSHHIPRSPHPVLNPLHNTISTRSLHVCTTIPYQHPVTQPQPHPQSHRYGLTIIPALAPQLESFDALELGSNCGVTRPTAPLLSSSQTVTATVAELPASTTRFHVDPTSGSDQLGNGTEERPFKTLHAALKAGVETDTRSLPFRPPPCLRVCGL